MGIKIHNGFSTDEDGMLLGYAGGYQGDEESGVSWVVFWRGDCERFCKHLGYEPTPENIARVLGCDGRGTYRGPGQAFRAPSVARVGRNRVLVTTFSGLDI